MRFMATIVDIAKKAGVSTATVSYVLNKQKGNVPISEKTQKRVMLAVRELGYRRNEIARSMVSGKTRVIGFVLHILRLEHIGKILEGVLDESEKNGYFIKILRVNANMPEQDIVRICMENRLAGLLISGIQDKSLKYIHTKLSSEAVPIVAIDNALPLPGLVRILSDDRGGIGQAVKYLHEMGHGRIAFMSGIKETWVAMERDRGYRDALVKIGLPLRKEFIRYGNWEINDTERETEVLLKMPERPTAVVCASDDMATIFIRKARQMGLIVPKDLSVTGFADQPSAQLGDPALTTVKQPFGEMGALGLRRLVELIEGKNNEAVPGQDTIILATELIVRESTAQYKTH